MQSQAEEPGSHQRCQDPGQGRPSTGSEACTGTFFLSNFWPLTCGYIVGQGPISVLG
jgi:hypothetical protein